MKNCPGCNSRPGVYHQYGCKYEQCSSCGMQYISCGCPDQEELIPWSGEYPGVAECREFGFIDPDTGREDLNRLFDSAEWDNVTKRFVLP